MSRGKYAKFTHNFEGVDSIFKDGRTGLFLPDSIRPLAKGYSEAGASHMRRALKGFNARSGSPNEDINWHNSTLRQRGRMLYMSSPVATSAINTNRTKVVGVGLTLKSAIDREILGLTPEEAKEWQRRTEREFSLWAERKANCDATGMNNLAGMQQLALVSWLMSGDCFVLFKRGSPSPGNPYSLRLHLIEADRISTPGQHYGYAGGTNGPFYSITDGKNQDTGNRIYDGVEVDASGLAVAYHVRNTYPFQYDYQETKWERVEAYGKRTGFPNILHIMSSERPDQYRGVTYLAQVIEPLLQLRRYTESALMMALVQSFFTAWVVTKDDPNRIPWNEAGGGDVAGIPGANPADSNISHSENEYEMGPGTINTMAEDEDIKFGNPTMPVAGFDEFIKTFCKLIGAGLGVPYDVLVKEYNSSYSAARGALMDAWDDFRMRRSWLVDDFCKPTYEVWLAEAVARGRISAPGFFDDPLIRAAWSGSLWIGPIQASLDPQREVNAAILQIQHALKTHEQVTREQGGGDWDANVEQLKGENERLSDAGAVFQPLVPDGKEKENGEGGTG